MIDSAAKDAAARLAPANARFLDFVERHPAALERASFSHVDRPNPYLDYPLQPWPLFVDGDALAELRQAAVAVPRLLFSLPERLFANDPAKIGAHCGLPPQEAGFLAGVLGQGERVRGLLARGDFVYAADGFRCLEVNVASALGGWQAGLTAALYQADPTIQRFLAEAGLRMTSTDPGVTVLRHVLEAALPLTSGGELNLVFATSPGFVFPAAWQSWFDRTWQQLLGEHGSGLAGSVTACAAPLLEVKRERLLCQGRRVHAVIELYPSLTPEAILRPWLAGHLQLYNGPLKVFFHDKRTLALLSEHANSDAFTADERALIARHVPWTRRVQDGLVVDPEGRRRSLPELLATEPAKLVLKPALGYSGQDVHLGRATAPERWTKTVAQALHEGTWVVQEYVEALPLPLQSGACGWAPHTVVWGPFACGERFGGGFLRMAPQREERVVSSGLGATEGLFFEVSPA